MSSLSLHPDRALPFPAEQRSVAREIYAETKDLPLVCMHGHVEPEVFADDQPVRRPGAAADRPRPLRVPDAGLPGHRARPPRGAAAATAARSSPTHGRSGVRSARTGSCFRGHALALLAGTRAGRGVRGRPGAERRNRRRHLRQDRGLRRRTGLPTPGPAGPLPDRGHLHHRRGHLGPGAARAGSRPTASASGCCPPSGRTPWPTSTGRPGATTSPSWRRSRGSTRRRTTASSTPCVRGAPPSSRPAPGPPTTATCWPTPPRWRRARPGELYARILGGAEASPAEVDAFAANMLFVMAEMSCEDGLVMQIHPGVLRNHSTAIFDDVRAGQGLRHSRSGPSSPRPCGRCWTASAPIRGSG